jgi:hypothetical protein
VTDLIENTQIYYEVLTTGLSIMLAMSKVEVLLKEQNSKPNLRRFLDSCFWKTNQKSKTFQNGSKSFLRIKQKA